MAHEPNPFAATARLSQQLQDARIFDRESLSVVSEAMKAMALPSVMTAMREMTRPTLPGSALAVSQMVSEATSSITAFQEISARMALPEMVLHQVGLHPELLSSMGRTAAAIDTFALRVSQQAQLAGLSDTIRAVSQRVAAPLINTQIDAGSLLAVSTFAREITRQFDLARTTATAASLVAAMQPVLGNLATLQSVTARLAQPGFQTTAMLGLQRLAPGGVVADVLAYYDQASFDNAPIFGDALAATRLFDQEAAPLPEAIDQLRALWARIGGRLRHERDHVTRAGLLVVAGFVVTLLSFLVALHTDQNSPTHTDAAKQTAAIEAVGRQVAAQRADEATRQTERDHHIRYLHASALLRAEPDAKGLVLQKIFPDQLLRAIEERGAWVKVEAFAYHTDQPTVGWISRRKLYVRPME